MEGSGLNWLIPEAGLNEEGKERSHAEKVQRARLAVEFWREGRCEVDGLSVLLFGERVKMFFVYRKTEEVKEPVMDCTAWK